MFFIIIICFCDRLHLVKYVYLIDLNVYMELCLQAGLGLL